MAFASPSWGQLHCLCSQAVPGTVSEEGRGKLSFLCLAAFCQTVKVQMLCSREGEQAGRLALLLQHRAYSVTLGVCALVVCGGLGAPQVWQ